MPGFAAGAYVVDANSKKRTDKKRKRRCSSGRVDVYSEDQHMDVQHMMSLVGFETAWMCQRSGGAESFERRDPLGTEYWSMQVKLE